MWRSCAKAWARIRPGIKTGGSSEPFSLLPPWFYPEILVADAPSGRQETARSEREMTRDVVAAADVAQLGRGRRIGAHGGPALRLVHRAARRESAAAQGPLEIKHSPRARPGVRERRRSLSAPFFHQGRP